MCYIHTYIVYWLVPTGLFRVNMNPQILIFHTGTSRNWEIFCWCVSCSFVIVNGCTEDIWTHFCKYLMYTENALLHNLSVQPPLDFEPFPSYERTKFIICPSLSLESALMADNIWSDALYTINGLNVRTKRFACVWNERWLICTTTTWYLWIKQ